MITAYLPMIVSEPFLAIGAVAAVVAILTIMTVVRCRYGRITTIAGAAIVFLAIIAIGMLWFAAVDPIGREWSIAGLGQSPDLIGTGTSIQRSLGSGAVHDPLLSGSLSFWPAIAGSVMVVGAVSLSVTILSRRRRFASAKQSIKN